MIDKDKEKKAKELIELTKKVIGNENVEGVILIARTGDGSYSLAMAEMGFESAKEALCVGIARAMTYWGHMSDKPKSEETEH